MADTTDETTSTTTTTTLFGNPAPTPSSSATDAPTNNGLAPDEDCSKEYEPVVRLAEVETKTGEEDEEVVYKVRAKLFRFSKERGEWKERGTGDVRILRHKVNDKIRLLMRREKTLKICLNHYVNASVELKENVGSDRSWVWHAVDYSDGEADHSMLAIRFRDSDTAQGFKTEYDNARTHMAQLASAGGAEKKEAEEAEEEKKEEESESKEEEADKKEEAEADDKKEEST